LNPEQCYTIINPNFKPFVHQRESWDLIEEENIGFCLLSGTGSGKTEAICIPSIFLNKRLVMIYPTRSLIEDQIDRMEKYLEKVVSHGDALSKIIAYDTGDRQYGKRIRLFEGRSSLEMVKGKIEFYQRWNSNLVSLIVGEGKPKAVELEHLVPTVHSAVEKFSGFIIEVDYSRTSSIKITPKENMRLLTEKSRKHLYNADIILTTLDMFLYRFFGFGQRKWNLLYPYRLYMGEQARKRLVICFDEAHLYDTVSFTNFINLVSTFTAAGIKVVVMSATLPERLMDVLSKRYGLRNVIAKGKKSGEKKIVIEKEEGREICIRRLVEDSIGDRVIITRNTVSAAFKTYEAIKKVSKELPFLYHGRMFPSNRTNVYRELKERDQKRQPYILVTTSAVEVGCDLNANLLITDYCNPDQLIQRMGRCGRKKETKGTIIILGTDFQENDSFLRLPDAYDYQTYNELLCKESFHEESIRATITPRLKREELTDTLFQLLYSYAYEFDVMRKELHDSGIVVTRSWVPSFKLLWVKEKSALRSVDKAMGEKSIEAVIDMLWEDDLLISRSPLQIPLDYFILRDGDQPVSWKQLRVVAITDSKSPKGYSHRRTINPYLVDLYLFLMDDKYPNHNPSLGLIKVSRFLREQRTGIITTVRASKRYFADSNTERQIRYLHVS